VELVQSHNGSEVAGCSGKHEPVTGDDHGRRVVGVLSVLSIGLLSSLRVNGVNGTDDHAEDAVVEGS